MIFNGRNQIPFNYSRWGWTRGGGKTWHGGADIVGLDDTTVRMPSYNGKTISGTVRTATIITNRSNLTWEWGWYVCVKLDANQTPDAVNYLYFCHNERLLVKVGQKVKTGDALAIMGNTGNAAYASPPIKHVHFEVRAATNTKGLDPSAYMGFANAVGTYGKAPESTKPLSSDPCIIKVYSTAALSSGDMTALKKVATEKGLEFKDSAGAAYIGPASAGDQIAVINVAKELGLKYEESEGSPKRVKVTTDSLRVRTGPDAAVFNQVGTVKNGEVFDIIQSYNGWYFIDTDDMDGWISGEYAKEV